MINNRGDNKMWTRVLDVSIQILSKGFEDLPPSIDTSPYFHCDGRFTASFLPSRAKNKLSPLYHLK
jgi:hypothetical protein